MVTLHVPGSSNKGQGRARLASVTMFQSWGVYYSYLVFVKAACQS